MEQVFITASVWVGVALLATFAASQLRISVALTEIVLGVFAAALASQFLGVSILEFNNNIGTRWR